MAVQAAQELAGLFWPRFMEVDGYVLVADHFEVHLQGGVAWAEGLGRLINQSGAERTVRMSGVLVREHGQWVIVQSHASLPVQDAEIFKLASG